MPKKSFRHRWPVTFVALSTLAVSIIGGSPAAQASPLDGLVDIGKVTQTEIASKLATSQPKSLSDGVSPSRKSCETFTNGDKLCNQVAADLSAATKSAMSTLDDTDEAHDDDSDPGTDGETPASCSVTLNSYNYSRFSYCYNLTVTTTFTDAKDGVFVSHSLINGRGTLHRNSGFWQEEDLITLVDGEGPLATSNVLFNAGCSGGSCVALSNWPTTGTPMVPGESLTADITFSAAPAAGESNNLSPSYTYSARPATKPATGTPATWSATRPVRCDKTMVRNTSIGCVIASHIPVLSISAADNRYGAAAVTYLYGEIYLAGKFGTSESKLTRIDDVAKKTKNRRQTCEDLASVKFEPRDDIVPNDSCDEYPFAGTKQGGTDGALCAEIVPLWHTDDKSWHIHTFTNHPNTGKEPCVRSHVPLLQNTTAGSKYAGFINSWHVIGGEDFIVHPTLT